MNSIESLTRKVEILIVEDSLTQAEQLKYLLESHGYLVDVTYNGSEALQYLETRKPDIIISDIVMPEMDGYALCRHIKQDESLRDIRVILLTTLSDPVDVIRGLNSGADNFLTKPYSDEMLVARLQNILVNNEIRKHGGTQMGMEIYFAGKKHYLTAERIQIIDLLLATYENAVQKSRELEESHRELRKAYDTIIVLESTYRTLLEQNADAMVVIGIDGVVRYANLAAEELLGCCREILVGSLFGYPLSTDEPHEITIVCPDGSERVAEMRVVVTNWEREDAYLASLRDVTANVRLRKELSSLSLTDELTRLYNRRGFLTMAEQRRKEAYQHKTGFSILFADIDDMKDINDTHGHAAGDLALVDTASLLREAVRESDIVARIAGDEFAVLATGTVPQNVEAILERMQQALDAHNASGTRAYALAISVGVAHYDPQNTCSIAELLNRADRSMYQVKSARKAEKAVPKR